MTPFGSPARDTSAQPKPKNEEPAKRGKHWLLWSIGFVVCVFFFLLDFGTFYLDRSKEMHLMFSGGAGVTGLWTITEVLKAKTGWRIRAITFGVIAAMAVAFGTTGFLLGEESAYPSDQKALVHEIGPHVREVKTIKEQIGGKRGSMNEPAELLSVEPLVKSWKEHVAQIRDIDKHIKHDQIPVVVNKILKLMDEGLVFDDHQIQNLSEQFNVIKDAEKLPDAKRSAFYKVSLDPLEEEEQKIETARQAANLQQRIQDAAKP
jgi:hypothetical protein